MCKLFMSHMSTHANTYAVSEWWDLMDIILESSGSSGSWLHQYYDLHFHPAYII